MIVKKQQPHIDRAPKNLGGDVFVYKSLVRDLTKYCFDGLFWLLFQLVEKVTKESSRANEVKRGNWVK